MALRASFSWRPEVHLLTGSLQSLFPTDSTFPEALLRNRSSVLSTLACIFLLKEIWFYFYLYSLQQYTFLLINAPNIYLCSLRIFFLFLLRFKDMGLHLAPQPGKRRQVNRDHLLTTAQGQPWRPESEGASWGLGPVWIFYLLPPALSNVCTHFIIG